MGYYDVGGKEIYFSEWAPLLVDDEYANVEQDELSAVVDRERTDMYLDVLVRTRWIGLNRGHCDGPLKIFETKIVPLVRESESWVVQYYSNRPESRRGHASVIYNMFQANALTAELPVEPVCVCCGQVPIKDLIKLGEWNCKPCQAAVSAGELTYPKAALYHVGRSLHALLELTSERTA